MLNKSLISEIEANHLESINSLFIDLEKNQKTVGFNITINSNNDNLLLKSFGKLSLNSEHRSSIDTLFAQGSISKSFTSLSMLILAEQGKLSIYDPISKFLPINLDGMESEIQIHHLMSHSSGLPNLYICPIIEKQAGLRNDYNLLNFDVKLNSWDDIFRYIESNKRFIINKPGEKFHYSDLGYSLLQFIIETTSGIKHGQFLKKHIFDPLSMKNATVRSEYDEMYKAASGHFSPNQTGNGVQVAPANYPMSEFLDGGGGVMADEQGMQNYLQFMMNYGNFQNHQLISRESYELLTTPKVTISKDAGLYYGFGWIISNSEQGNIVFHTGHTGAITSAIGFSIENKIGAHFSNNISYPPLPILVNILKIISDSSISFGSRRNLISKLEPFVGNYASPGNIESVSVNFNEGKIFLKFSFVNVFQADRKEYLVYPYIDNSNKFNEKYYIIHNGIITPVKFETKGDQFFITIGISKFIKI